MPDEKLPQVGSGGLEGLKKVNDYGGEYWCARDLQPLLGYSQWRRFENAIRKSVTSCEQSGNEPSHHFASAGKPIPGGKGSEAMCSQIATASKRNVDYLPNAYWTLGVAVG